MSTRSLAVLFCDYDECDAMLLGAFYENTHSIRRRAKRHGWKWSRTEPRDLCPDHAVPRDPGDELQL